MPSQTAAPTEAQKPKVTVVIPSFNVQAYIALSLQSVLAQTYKDFEVLVLNDGSSDRTVEIASTFTDPRVRVVTQVNRGLAGARNGGIRAARGQYLAFLDADDLWTTDKLARHVAHLDANPQVGVSYCPSDFIDDDGRMMGVRQSPKLRDISQRDVFLRNPVGNGSAPVIRRATLDAIAYPAPPDAPIKVPGEQWYFDESFRQSEDIECWTRIALTTDWRFEGLDAPLTLYRVNTGGLSANLEKQLASWERMVAKTAVYAPAFIAQWAGPARAYQYRYLARRAIRMGHNANARSLLNKALKAHPGMLLEEPLRTGITLGAAAVQAVVPKALYQRVETWGMQMVGGLSKRAEPAKAASLDA